MKWLGIILIFTSIGCARPRYFQSANGNETTTQQAASCLTKTSQTNLCVSVNFAKGPNTTESSDFTLKIYRLNDWDQTAVPLDLSAIQVKLWMPSMGHGSSPVLLTRKDVGTYYVEQVHFIMPGDWQIQISDGANDHAILDLQIL